MNTQSASVKQQLITACKNAINKRLIIVQQSITSVQQGLKSETKSTAGDKHETGRAMLQLKREQLGQQLAIIETEFQLINALKKASNLKTVGFGSVVYTTSVNYFISLSCGEVVINNQKFYAISRATPIAKVMLGKSVNSTIHFNGNTFKIVKLE